MMKELTYNVPYRLLSPFFTDKLKGQKDSIKNKIQKNYKIIKGWIYYKIICFLQKRNPNVPAIAFKIEAPKSRNLTRAPTFKNINSSKSDNLPSYQEYIDKFCSVQYEAFCYLCDKKKEKDLDCYIDVMRLENPFEFLKYKSREEFNDKLKQTISPIYQIALNQGFEVLNKVYK